MTITLLQADARHIPLPSGSVHCAVTSPPYWGLRDYGHDGQLGLERAPDCLGWATGAPCGECYVCRMVQVFREVRRVLRDDGVCFLNLGDSYASATKGDSRTAEQLSSSSTLGPRRDGLGGRNAAHMAHSLAPVRVNHGLKPKDLCGIPWRVALALQADGWWLRSDIIWHKPAPMPESVTDRPTRAHENIFLLSKQERYFYDAEAVKELLQTNNFTRTAENGKENGELGAGARFGSPDPTGRNQRDVWTLGPAPYPGAHFATFPPELPRRCILAGTSAHGVCPACGAPWERVTERERIKVSDSKRYSGVSMRNDAEDGRFRHVVTATGWLPTCTCDAGDPVPATVLDPFVGSGTTLMVARSLGRNGIGLDLSEAYLQQARQRLDLDKLDAWHGEEPTPGAMDDFDALPLFAV